MTALAIDLSSVNMAHAGITGWATKKDASAVLAALREKGRNVERCIEIHPAHNWLFRFWVVGRPDPLSEFTWLMVRDGSWVRGRLYDGYFDRAAEWVHMPTPEPIPATVTHDYRYTAGTCGVVGHDGKPLMTYGPDGLAREQLGWLERVWCIACTWSFNGPNEASARAAARSHRANPGDLPLRA